MSNYKIRMTDERRMLKSMLMAMDAETNEATNGEG